MNDDEVRFLDVCGVIALDDQSAVAQAFAGAAVTTKEGKRRSMTLACCLERLDEVPDSFLWVFSVPARDQ